MSSKRKIDSARANGAKSHGPVTDEGRKKFLLATVAVVRRELTRVLAVMGISIPAVM